MSFAIPQYYCKKVYHLIYPVVVSRYRRLVLVLLSVQFSFFCVHAEDFDSLLSAFNKNTDSERANAVFSYLEDAEFLDGPLQVGEETAHDSLCAVVWYWAAEWYYDTQDFRRSKQYGLQSLPLCNAVGDKTMEADCASLLGLIYVRLGEFDKAAVYAKRCNELDLESGDNNNISSSYNTLAGIYMSMRQADEAERYILKAIEYVEKTDNLPRKAVIYGMASEVYQHKYGDAYRLQNSEDKGMTEKTLAYATRAWEIEKQLGRADKAAIRQTQRAAAMTVLERYKEAEDMLVEAIPVIEASGNIHSLGIAYNQMGDLMYVQGRNPEGADYYYKALDIFVAQHDIYNEAHTRKGLRETLRGINPEEALFHGDRFEHLRDSIYDAETNENLSHYAAQYENDILQELNKQQHRRYILLVVLIIVLFALLAVAAYIVYRAQHKRQLVHLNKLLQEAEHIRAQARARKNLETTKRQSEVISMRETAVGEENMVERYGVSSVLSDDRLFLARVVELVNAGMSKGAFSIEHLARSLAMSESTFRRRMLSATGDSPKNFILAIQMERAAEMLTTHPEVQIKDVALQCGFSESGSFTRTFQRFYGVTPTQYRENKGTIENMGATNNIE